MGNFPMAIRARMLRLAADVALQEAATVTEEEFPAAGGAGLKARFQEP